MPKAPSLPTGPSIAETTAASEAANRKSYQDTMAGATIGQNTASTYSNYTTQVDPITGQLKYVANTGYTPTEQAVFDQNQAARGGSAGTANDMISALFGRYSDPNQTNLVGQGNNLTLQALQGQIPAWNQLMLPAQAQLNTQLLNQGITQNSPAYKQAMAQLMQTQGNTEGQWLSNFTPQAFNMAQQDLNNPANLLSTFMNNGKPTDVPGSFINTPTGTEGNTDVASITAANVKAQQDAARAKQDAQNNMLGGLFGTLGKVASLPTNSVGGSMLGSLML